MKSIAFPISIAVNEVCGNYNPVEGEALGVPHEYLGLTEGDIVKIDLGVQIEGLPALVSHTVIVQSNNQKVTGKKADLILATYYSIQLALRLLRQERSNNDITALIAKVAADFKVNQLEGVLSHRMKRDIIDGPETIINKQTFDQKVDTRKFVPGDIFGLDVIFSSGEGIPKEVR
jgi:methionine aminopeptidase